MIRYCEERAAEKCAASVLTRWQTSLHFFERVAAIPLHERFGSSDWVHRQVAALGATLPAKKPTKQAPRPCAAMVLAWERLVMRKDVPTVLRVWSWWKLLALWGTMRHGDHVGLSPKDCEIVDGSFQATLTKTKTTVRGSKHWSPRVDLLGWIEKRCTYKQARSLSATVERMMLIDGAPLFLPGVAGRFFTEHSCRCFLPSAASCLKESQETIDGLGGWRLRKGGASTCARCAGRR